MSQPSLFDAGLRYHIWSTDQEFRFVDFPSLRQCTCAIDVVPVLPLLGIRSVVVNDRSIDALDQSSTYHAQVHRGEEYVERG